MKIHETQASREVRDPYAEETNSFNDLTEYNRTVLGVAAKRADLGAMPKPVRFFAYFFYGFLILAFLAFVLTLIYKS